MGPTFSVGGGLTSRHFWSMLMVNERWIQHTVNLHYFVYRDAEAKSDLAMLLEGFRANKQATHLLYINRTFIFFKM
jgi:hypothetical protein